jgi:hypothetical protein
MTVQLELWQLITLLLAFFAAVSVAARMFMAQMNKGLDDRFNALNSRMAEDGKWQAELPNQYVRKEDWIRNQTIIELKIDRLGDQILKGLRND